MLDTGYPGDDACLPPPDPALGFQIHIGPPDYVNVGSVTPFLLDPGQERSECYNFETPNGNDVNYWGVHLSVRAPALRTAFELYSSPNTGSGFVVCRGTSSYVGRLASGVGGETLPRARAPENDGLQGKIPSSSPGQSTQLLLRQLHRQPSPADDRIWRLGAFSGMLDVSPGDTLEWECHVVNDSAITLRFTNEVERGEMCALFGETLGGTRCE